MKESCHPVSFPAVPAWHALDCAEVLARLETSSEGLSSEEAARRLIAHGPNCMPRQAEESWVALVWRQIHNPISWLLVASGILAVLLGKTGDSLVVFGAVGLNALIGVLQEKRAGKAIAALAAMTPENAGVLRDGRMTSLSSHDLAPGDVVHLASGDKAPADLRLLHAKNLRMEESALTGESAPVGKRIDPVHADAALGDRFSLVFSGTLVTQGTGDGVVIATGGKTELGRINALLERAGQMETPLIRQLAQVSGWITLAVLSISVVLFLFSVFVKEAKAGEALFTAVTLAVAAIPEGLPAIITIALAIGVQRMAARRAVVRHLPAVETLGSTSVICSDKTGTLTRNEMTVQALWIFRDGDGREYRVGGIGYAPVGAIERDGHDVTASLPANVRELLAAGTLCNDALLELKDGVWTISGDPTEAALVVAARKAGLEEDDLRRRHPRKDALPFESDTRYMAVWNQGAGLDNVYLKGATETVIERCRLTPEAAARVREAEDALAAQGMRVLALARRPPEPGMSSLTAEWASSGFTLLGLAGMIDPPRQEAIEAIAVCRKAGITVKMITGDHRGTAAAIGRDLGLLEKNPEALEGVDLERMDATELRDAVRRCHVFARVAPEHKIRIVEALQAGGQIVAMTGDGVNDAPALKRADIGVAMGITGTAVSKEAAKIVLADDNFATIASAVEEGRRVYDNLVKALVFLLPTNLGLAGVLAGGAFFFPTVEVENLGRELLLPMSPTQILWINLVASVALTIPIAFETLEPGAMRRPPRLRGEAVFSGFILLRTVLVALLIAVATCLLYFWEYRLFTGGSLGGIIPEATHRLAQAEAQSIAVTTVILFQIFYLLNCRSLRGSILEIGLFSNPPVWVGIGGLLLLQMVYLHLAPLQRLFGSQPLDFEAWGHAILAGLTVFALVGAEKAILRRLRKRGAGGQPAPAT
ncbi:MAG: HAD-IC family P-type ATPase [Verrucomicrobiae bacterium]|nr:HAD-IC family P-type ATPase [Verrucomicrobiae bacterium]